MSESAAPFEPVNAQTDLAVLATDEVFWTKVAGCFAKPPSGVFLDYGYYHPAALSTLRAEIAALESINLQAASYKRGEMKADHERARSTLAALAGVPTDEVAITRNASEAMNILINGIELAPGDEIVFCDQDYGSMVEALEQRARRFGVVLRAVTLPLDPASDDEVVAAFAAAMTARTRLLHVTHLINHTGQVLPVRKICDYAHARGVEVMVDAAHSFAQLDFTLPELDCDYLGASLHKWLCSPLGMGLLYVRRDKIARVWPLMADARLAANDIRRLEHLGNRPDSAHIGLLEAIRFHRSLGAAKGERLRWLQRRWTEPLRGRCGVRLWSPSDPARQSAIATFSLAGVPAHAVQSFLLEQHGVFTAVMQHPIVQGVRVTPGLPTAARDIDRLSAGIEAALVHFKI